jgi:hypothetical protein
MADIRLPKIVIERLCALVTEVGSRKYKFTAAHDCFCGVNPLGIDGDFRVDESILIFIEQTVEEKLNEEKWE